MSENSLNKKNIILLANGEFPSHNKPLQLLSNAEYIICCDGAANSLKKINKTPHIIIGDLDSLDKNLIDLQKTKVINIEEQNNNDLRKALYWISENMNIQKLSLIGSTGLRDDHTIGNIASFLYDKYNFDIEILTDAGCFHVINQSRNIATFIGQPISFFCASNKQKITASGLQYKLENSSINLYSATLNTAQTTQVKINLELDIPVLIYLPYKK